MANELQQLKDGNAINFKAKGKPNATLHALDKLIEALPQADLPLDHFFSDGIYMRVMTLEPSTLLTGKTHKHNHLAILLEGQVAVHSRQGTAVFEAPYIVNVLAGDKRAFFSVTKVKWATVHATEETDLELLEQTLVEEN